MHTGLHTSLQISSPSDVALGWENLGTVILLQSTLNGGWGGNERSLIKGDKASLGRGENVLELGANHGCAAVHTPRIRELSTLNW